MPNININWDPPKTWYMYAADCHCPECADAIMAHSRTLPDYLPEWESANDSDTWPIEFPRGEGEADSPDHCGNIGCQRFLGRNLTEDGVEYVRQTALEELDQHGGVGPIVQGWLDYYDYIELDA